MLLLLQQLPKYYLVQLVSKIINVGILVSVFGCINGYLLTGPRITYTLGKQKTIPVIFGKLNKNDVPANATLLMAVLSALYALSDNSTY